MGSYYGEGNTSREMVESGKWEGVSLGAYGDTVNISDSVDVDVLIRFAQSMFHRALRAENTVQMFSDTAQRNTDARLKIATLFGESAKAAAIQQEWCGEYEQWTEKIRETLSLHGFYSEAAHYAEAAERRQKFTVTVEFLARNGYAAQDLAYALQGYEGETYGCKIVETSDATAVVPEQENNDTDETEEVSF